MAGVQFPDGMKRVIDGRPETIRRNCEDSLQRLGAEVIDPTICQWPGPCSVRGSGRQASALSPGVTRRAPPYLEQPFTDRFLIYSDVIESRERCERLETEYVQERRDAIPHCAAGTVLTARLGDQAPLDEGRNGRVGGDTPDLRDLRT